MARSAPTFRSFVSSAAPPPGTKERASFVKSLAEARVKSGESKTLAGAVRTVQRRITDSGQKRGQAAPISKQERAAARSFFKAHPVIKDAVDGKAARSADAKYRLLVQTFADKQIALDRAAQLKAAINTPPPSRRGKTDSPTKLDHAKQIEIDFVPEGGRYHGTPESNASLVTAPAGGVYVVTVKGD